MTDRVIAPVRLSVTANEGIERSDGTGARPEVAGPPPSKVSVHPRDATGPARAMLSIGHVTLWVVTILVDDCRWWWRGRRWCHLVSDDNLEELHEFAAALGLPRYIFQGDHYDLHEGLREMAVRLGAEPVTSRELVARLRSGGLRLSPAARRQATAAEHR
jgi:hypothetical protein